jgi:hypothetical protein
MITNNSCVPVHRQRPPLPGDTAPDPAHKGACGQAPAEPRPRSQPPPPPPRLPPAVNGACDEPSEPCVAPPLLRPRPSEASQEDPATISPFAACGGAATAAEERAGEGGGLGGSAASACGSPPVSSSRARASAAFRQWPCVRRGRSQRHVEMQREPEARALRAAGRAQSRIPRERSPIHREVGFAQRVIAQSWPDLVGASSRGRPLNPPTHPPPADLHARSAGPAAARNRAGGTA